MVLTQILIVTSDDTVAHDLQERLKGLGYRVVGIATSHEATRGCIEALKPDLVLADIRQQAGGETKTGKFIQTKYNLPVVYITGNIGQATIQRARPTGPFGYIYKPFDNQQLLVTIETALARHNLERKLWESKQWLNTTLTSIGDGVIATDDAGLIRFINPAASQLTGWQNPDALGKPLQEVFVLSTDSSQNKLDLAAIQAKGKNSFEAVLFSRYKTSKPVETNATLIIGETGKTLGTVLVFRDITQQRSALCEIQRQAERAETLLQVASQINTEVGLDIVLQKICEAATRTLKSLGSAILLKDPARNVYRCVAVTGAPPLVKGCHASHFEASISVIQSIVRTADAAEIILGADSYPNPLATQVLTDLDIATILVIPLQRYGQAIGILLSFFTTVQTSLPEDERKLIKGLADQAGIAITNAYSFEQVRASRERQQFLAHKLVKLQEEERRSLARELHDEIGQMLTGLQFTIKSSMSHSNEDQRNKLDQAQIIVSAIISQIRELSINLRPSLLDDLGILPTLEWYFNRYEAKTGIEVHFNHEKLGKRFSTDLETAAFRIVQEALTNVARYAEAVTVDISLTVRDSVMHIEIRDQGRGFDMTRIHRNTSLGIEGMRERAYVLGGLLDIHSEPGKGTHIQASLPISGHIERRNRERDRIDG